MIKSFILFLLISSTSIFANNSVQTEIATCSAEGLKASIYMSANDLVKLQKTSGEKQTYDVTYVAELKGQTNRTLIKSTVDFTYQGQQTTISSNQTVSLEQYLNVQIIIPTTNLHNDGKSEFTVILSFTSGIIMQAKCSLL